MYTTAVTPEVRRHAPVKAVVEAARRLDAFLDELRRRRVDGPAVDILVEEAAALRPLLAAAPHGPRPARPGGSPEEAARELLAAFEAVHRAPTARRHRGLEALPERLAAVVVALRNLLDLPDALGVPGNVVRGSFTR